MAGYLTPMLLTVGTASANSWYNTGQVPIKELLAGGIATGILGVLNSASGLSPVITGIAWLAFLGLMVGNVQHPSPLQNINKIVGVKT